MKKLILSAAVLMLVGNAFADITIHYKHEGVIARTQKDVTLVAFPEQPAKRKEYKVPHDATGTIVIKATAEETAKGVNVVTSDQESNPSAKVNLKDGGKLYFRAEKAAISEVSANLNEKP